MAVGYEQRRQFDREFDVTEEHCELLKKMYVTWWDCEFGAPGIDPKWPYGNSYVEGDVAEVLKWPCEEDDDGELVLTAEQKRRAQDLHEEIQTALQVLLSCLSISPGRYIKDREYGIEWRRADA